MDESVYREALGLAAASREALAEILQEYDCLMTFSAPGEAPRSATGTGDSVFNRAWTTIGAPCITLPVGIGERPDCRWACSLSMLSAMTFACWTRRNRSNARCWPLERRGRGAPYFA